MKYLLLIVLFFSCNDCGKECIMIDSIDNYTFETDIDVSNIREAVHWIRDNIEYKNDPYDYWKLPQETYKDKAGDCEDIALLFLYICRELLYINDCYLIRIIQRESYHIVPEVNGRYYEPLIGGELLLKPERKIFWRCSYPVAIWMTLHYHDSVGSYL